jgi:hypothetical protein
VKKVPKNIIEITQTQTRARNAICQKNFRSETSFLRSLLASPFGRLRSTSRASLITAPDGSDCFPAYTGAINSRRSAQAAEQESENTAQIKENVKEVDVKDPGECKQSTIIQ